MHKGILVINKDKDMTSHDVVSVLRRKLNIKKIGHTGTLDPMATGVLPICIGKATKIAEYISNQGKSYEAKLKFGQETTTYDSTGDIVNSSIKDTFTREEIEKALKGFVGEISQYPPKYSAIKVNGKKLYEYARKNIDVEIKPRNIIIYDIKLLELNGSEAKIYVSCSKGTYIRSLIHDLGIKLGTYAHMIDLVRTRVGNFTLENSIAIKDIDKFSKEYLFERLISISDSLYNYERLYLDEQYKYRLINGQRINIKDLNEYDLPKNEIFLLYADNDFLGLASIKDNILKMEKLIWQE